MALRRRLLERLLDDPSAGRRGEEDPETVLASITESLRRILNSGRGEASTDGRYGLPDLRGVARNMPYATDTMKEAIREAIERYEPRLRRVRVRNVTDADASRLRFEIVAELNDDKDTSGRPLKFSTRLERDGRLEIIT
jgi:type VI secretion system protein